MPIYEYRCGICGGCFESYSKVEERDDVICCEKRAKRLISPPSRAVILDYYNESIDEHITGPRQRDMLYKKLDVHEVD